MTNKSDPSKVLITGGAGFIGSTLAKTLINLEHAVTVVDSLIPEYGGNLFNLDNTEVSFVQADVRDTDVIETLIKDKNILFNLAGQTSHMDSMTDPFTDLEINAHAQLSILEACRKHNPHIKVVYAGTRQIYGKPDYLPVNEDHPIRPTDINGIHKVAGEWYHKLYNDVYGIRSCTLRLTNTYGPRMRIKDARQTFVGVWLRSLVEGRPFEVWGGEQLRDFSFVDDTVDALIAAALSDEVNGMSLNLGGPERVSLKELAELLVEVNGSGSFEIKTFPEERKKIDIGDYYSDYSKARELLGWEPKVSLRDGLERTLAYYKENLKKYI